MTGLRNPTRTMFDFFDDPDGRTDRILRVIAAHQITAIAINHWAAFSGPPDPRLLAALAERYPDSANVGRYTLRWRP